MIFFIAFLKCYLLLLTLIQMAYTVRQLYFTIHRVRSPQPLSYHEILDSDLPSVTVMIPMHNEEKVANNILTQLLTVDYPADRLEIFPINDHSSDKTKEILDDFAARYPGRIRPLHRYQGMRGKPSALNAALEIAKGEIIIIFDADYIMPKNIIRNIAINFKDPSVGAVMGRVVPLNSGSNLLTRLLELERTGGYQVDQQSRYTLNLIPQYGGTAGGIRKELLHASGGFDPSILAEDTELTFRFYIHGWKVIYANQIECYEEVPEDWKIRGNQVRRWSRGHNQTMFRYFISFFKSPYISLVAKIDGFFLLLVYLTPTFLFLGMLALFALLAYGEIHLAAMAFGFTIFAAFTCFGNFAPFYQVNLGALIDGATHRINLIPFFCIGTLFNIWYITYGFYEAVVDKYTKRNPEWLKTQRFYKPK